MISTWWTWENGIGDEWGPFPQRDKQQKICYPRMGTGHYVWGEELSSAKQIWTSIHIRARWAYRSSCHCQPFGWIDNVYNERKRLGKDTAGYPLKLGMNAAYGTLASALGAEYDAQTGRFTKGWLEPRWAGLITAWTRARLLDALHLAGGAQGSGAIMFATDAIYTTRPIDLPTDDVLGGWEAHHFPEGGLLIQPGLYHLRGQDTVSKLKGRGIDFRDMQDHIDQFYEAWEQDGDHAQVTIPIRARYQGVKQTLHQGHLERAHRWVDGERVISMDPSGKRAQNLFGDWMPRPTIVGEPLGHEAFSAVMENRAAVLTDSDLELRATQFEPDAQPDGPYAL